MKISKILNVKTKKGNKDSFGFQKDTIEKAGREQIKKLVEKGLNFPIFVR